MNRRPQKKPALKKVPGTLNLPGGVTVRGFDFRITKLDERNRPVAFEIVHDGSGDSDCVLWAAEFFVNQGLPPDLLQRVRARDLKADALVQQTRGEPWR